MSNIKHTVETILQIISDSRGETSTNTGAPRIRAVSRANQDFARRRFWRTHLLKQQSITGDGSTDYTIGSATYPMRMKGLCEVYVGGTTEDKRYVIVDYQRYTNLFNKNNSERLAYEWFDAANDVWKVHINPTVETGTTAYYSYFWEPAAVTLTSDSVVCPDPRIIAKLALGEIYEGEDEDQKSLLVKQDAEQMVAEMVGMENTPAVNQTYSVGAIENSSSPHGIGSY